MLQTRALLVEGSHAEVLSPISLAGGGAVLREGKYDESWLQNLLQQHPEILPVEDIESGFGRLIPVAREVGCGHGSIDNLFVTADGGIAIVETKLWRNPQSRREVVAQALDYAAAIGSMTYDAFERAALGGLLSEAQTKPRSLYELAAAVAHDIVDESSFIDAIAGNLRRGRMLVIAAGDGIRSETETLAGLLQSHAGAHFTFALVAIELFACGEKVFAVPRTLAKTQLIERGIVRVVGGAVSVEPADSTTSAPARPRTMTEELFMEALKKRDPALPGQMRAFLERVARLGVEPSYRGALNLRWYGWPDGAVNLGVISKEGQVWTDPTNWRGADLARPYQEDVATALGVRTRDLGKGAFIVGKDGRSYVQIGDVLPEKAEAWAGAMERFIDRLRSEAETRG